jgi:penicillin-binding protein-related factor A (putative recombinase)
MCHPVLRLSLSLLHIKVTQHTYLKALHHPLCYSILLLHFSLFSEVWTSSRDSFCGLFIHTRGSLWWSDRRRDSCEIAVQSQKKKSMQVEMGQPLRSGRKESLPYCAYR